MYGFRRLSFLQGRPCAAAVIPDLIGNLNRIIKEYNNMEYKKQYQVPETELVRVVFEVNILSGDAQITGFGDQFSLD